MRGRSCRAEGIPDFASAPSGLGATSREQSTVFSAAAGGGHGQPAIPLGANGPGYPRSSQQESQSWGKPRIWRLHTP